MDIELFCIVDILLLQHIPYFLKYGPGFKLNPVSSWTHAIMDHEIN